MRGTGACPGKFFKYSPPTTSKNAVLWKSKPGNLSFASLKKSIFIHLLLCRWQFEWYHVLFLGNSEILHVRSVLVLSKTL